MRHIVYTLATLISSSALIAEPAAEADAWSKNLRKNLRGMNNGAQLPKRQFSLGQAAPAKAAVNDPVEASTTAEPTAEADAWSKSLKKNLNGMNKGARLSKRQFTLGGAATSPEPSAVGEPMAEAAEAVDTTQKTPVIDEAAPEQVSGAHTAIDPSIAGHVEEIKEEVKDVNNDVDGMKADVKSTEKAVKELGHHVDGVRRHVAHVDNDMEEVKSQIASVGTSVNEIQEFLKILLQVQQSSQASLPNKSGQKLPPVIGDMTADFDDAAASQTNSPAYQGAVNDMVYTSPRKPANQAVGDYIASPTQSDESSMFGARAGHGSTAYARHQPSFRENTPQANANLGHPHQPTTERPSYQPSAIGDMTSVQRNAPGHVSVGEASGDDASGSHQSYSSLNYGRAPSDYSGNDDATQALTNSNAMNATSARWSGPEYTQQQPHATKSQANVAAEKGSFTPAESEYGPSPVQQASPQEEEDDLDPRTRKAIERLILQQMRQQGNMG